MQPVEAIFFDLDDTLVDDERGYRLALTATVDELCRWHSHVHGERLYEAFLEASRRFWSSPDPDRVPRTKRTRSIDGRAIRLEIWQDALSLCEASLDLAADAASLYDLYRRVTYRLFDDTVAGLAALHGSFRLAVITNTTGDFALEKAGATGILPYFDLFVAASDFGAGKPDPSIFRFVLDKLGLDERRAVHVGDGPETDVAGAHNAGLTSVWLNRQGTVRDASHPEPHHEITSLRELEALLDHL